MSRAFLVVPTLTLFCMMLALGLELAPRDFAALRRRPRALAAGLAGQLLAVPLVAFALVLALPLVPVTAVGLILLAACPGGATSNMFSRYAGGDVALSISLTATTSLLAPLSVPLLVGLGSALLLGSESPIDLSGPDAVATLATTTVLPVALGMAGRRRWPHAAERCRGPLLAASALVLVLLLVGLAVNTIRIQEDLAGMLARSLLAAFLLLALAGGLAALGGLALRLGAARTRTLVLEVGTQNVNLALVVALTLLGEPALLGPTLVYLPLMLLFAAGVILFSRRQAGRA